MSEAQSPAASADASKASFFARWRAKLGQAAPVIKAEAARASMMGVAVAAIGMMVNDPALYPQVVTGLFGRFIADKLLRWRSAEKDVETQRTLIEHDLQADQNNPEVQALFQQLNLAEVVTEVLGDKLDGVSGQVGEVKALLQQLLDAGWAEREQIDARYSQGFVNNPVNSTITQTFIATQIIQQSQRYQRDALHQLRAIPDTFTGRAGEVAQGGAVAITSGITGLGGIGKTELANVIAHALSAVYPDAQLLLELNANGAAPRTPAQALTALLQQFYPTDRLPEDESSLRQLYLNTLSDKKAIVILDDCGSDADARKLLPPAGCVALITSRQNLATGERLKLEALPRQDSIALLRRYRPALSDAEADALAGLCADLPIALSVVGSLLSVYETMTAESFIASLKADRIGGLTYEDQSVQRVFAASYERLSPELRAIWCALSVMPADFDLLAAAAVGPFDREAAPSPLDELVRRNLIEFDTASERYRWHDLLHAFVTSKLSSYGRTEVELRFCQHFIEVANHVSQMFKLEYETFIRGLALFDIV